MMKRFFNNLLTAANNIPRNSRTTDLTHRQVPFRILLSAIIVLQVTASFAYPVAKYGPTAIEPFTFAFYRFALASIVLLAFAGMQDRSIPIERKDYPRIVLLGVLIIPFNQTLFLVGQSLTTAGHGAFLFATTTIWIFILALIYLGEKFRLRRMIGIVVALAGVALVMSTGAIEVEKEYLH